MVIEKLLEFQSNPQPSWWDNLGTKRQVKHISWEDNFSNLTDWSKNRVRYIRHGAQLIDGGTASQNIAVSLYIDALRNIGKEKFIHDFDLEHLLFDKKKTKEMSVFVKKAGPEISDDWRFLVDSDRLDDYQPYIDVKEFRSDLVDWVQRKVVHTWDGDEDLWYAIFEEEANNLFFYSGVTPDRILSIDDFFNNGDLWATTGSGYEPELPKPEIYDQTKKEHIKLKKNKWGLRWSTSKYELKRLLFKKRKQMCKAVQKSEITKLRAVISSDLSLYLKMSYISTFLDKVIGNREDSTLWMNKQQAFDMWQSFKADGTTRMPLDQSEFDHNASTRQIFILLKVIKNLIAKHGATLEMLEIMDLIMYALDGGEIYGVGENIAIKNGLLSGWRWTAMLGTMINRVELKMAQRYCAEKGQAVVTKADNSQGDDVWLKLNNRKDAFAIWYAYLSFGLDVNPKKFFVSEDRDEYLRKVLDKGVLTGYPARSVTSICFRNPIQEKEPPGPSRIRSNFTKWKLFSERCNKNIHCLFFYNHLLQDCKQAVTGINKAEVERFLFQDVQFGGIGMGHLHNDIIDLTERPTEYDKLDHSSMKGVVEWLEFIKPYGVDERSAAVFINSTLDFAPRYSVPKWVKYIYTKEELTQQQIPYGTDPDQYGTIAIGMAVKYKARQKRWPWYPSYKYLTEVKHAFYPSIGHISRPAQIKEIDIFADRMTPTKRLKKPRLKEGITQTLASLSSNPELVYDYIPPSLLHKPRSWVRDYLSNKLKAKISPVDGWGLDVTGFIGDGLLNVITTYFLSLKKPTLSLWESLLAKIDTKVVRVLDSLSLRIIE